MQIILIELTLSETRACNRFGSHAVTCSRVSALPRCWQVRSAWVVHACAMGLLERRRCRSSHCRWLKVAGGFPMPSSPEKMTVYCAELKNSVRGGSWWRQLYIYLSIIFSSRAIPVTQFILPPPPIYWGHVWQRVSLSFLWSPSGKDQGRPNNQPVTLGGNPISTLWSLPIVVKHQK